MPPRCGTPRERLVMPLRLLPTTLRRHYIPREIQASQKRLLLQLRRALHECAVLPRQHSKLGRLARLV